MIRYWIFASVFCFCLGFNETMGINNLTTFFGNLSFSSINISASASNPNSTFIQTIENLNSSFIGNSSMSKLVDVKHMCGIVNNDSTDSRPMRILLSTTMKYLPVLINWLAFYREACGSFANVYLVCLDNEVKLTLPKIGLYCSHTSIIAHDKNNIRHGALWLARTRIVNQLLLHGYDVLLTDSDAIWIQNPFPYLNRFASSDIISSRASFPKEMSKKWGAALCMGFIYIKSTHTMKLMWRELSKLMATQQTPDDQLFVNDYLLKHDVSFEKRLRYNVSSVADTGSFHLIENRTIHHEGKVTVLPDSLFRRICSNKQDVSRSLVAHCLAGKKNVKKIQQERAYGLWVLRAVWDTNTEYRSFDRFLNSVIDRRSTSNFHEDATRHHFEYGTPASGNGTTGGGNSNISSSSSGTALEEAAAEELVLEEGFHTVDEGEESSSHDLQHYSNSTSNSSIHASAAATVSVSAIRAQAIEEFITYLAADVIDEGVMLNGVDGGEEGAAVDVRDTIEHAQQRADFPAFDEDGMVTSDKDRRSNAMQYRGGAGGAGGAVSPQDIQSRFNDLINHMVTRQEDSGVRSRLVSAYNLWKSNQKRYPSTAAKAAAISSNSRKGRPAASKATTKADEPATVTLAKAPQSSPATVVHTEGPKTSGATSNSGSNNEGYPRTYVPKTSTTKDRKVAKKGSGRSSSVRKPKSVTTADLASTSSGLQMKEKILPSKA